MPTNTTTTLTTEVQNVPMAEMIRSMVMAIADAQTELDKSGFLMAEFMSGSRPLRDPVTTALVDAAGAPSDTPVMVDTRVAFGYDVVDEKVVPRLVSLMELGFVPRFYQFVDTIIDVKVVMRLVHKNTPIADVEDASAAPQIALSGTPLDAAYVATYGFNAQFASSIRTKIVLVPPPDRIQERLRAFDSMDSSAPPPKEP